MKTIHHIKTLFYYAGPQVFEARDAIGGHYAGLAIDQSDTELRFVVAGVSPEQLRKFRSGMIDLRSLMMDRSVEDWFTTRTDVVLGDALALETAIGRLSESEYLPDSGFLLHEKVSDDLALNEARSRNNLVLEVCVEPPEAAEEHRIRVETFVGLLHHLQMLVKHAYGAALRALPLSSRRDIDRSDAHLMDVVTPAAPGSFRVILEAAKLPDLLGNSELARALGRVDTLFESVANPERAAETLRANRGHLAGAYVRLLRFLVQHKTGLHYSWADPTFSTASHRSISESEVEPLVSLLSGVSNLSSEPVSLIGVLEEVDVTRKTWRISTQDGKYSGEVKEGGPSLVGLTTGKSYAFECTEEIKETDGTGREQRTLSLTEHKPA